MGLTLKNHKTISAVRQQKKNNKKKMCRESYYIWHPREGPELLLQMSHHGLKVFSFPLIKYGEGPEACQALGIESLFSVRMCFQSMEKMARLCAAM